MTSSDVALIRSIRPRRSRELVLGRARINAPRHGRVARKRSLCAIAIVFASLFHYDGVWRVPYPIRPDCQRILPSSLCSPAHASNSPSPLLSSSSPFPPSLSLSLSPLEFALFPSIAFVPLSLFHASRSTISIDDCAFHDDASLLFQRTKVAREFRPLRRANAFACSSLDSSRARVHIAVTMMCVILRRLVNVNPWWTNEEERDEWRERDGWRDGKERKVR